jgi:hypothetical protein
MVRPSRQKNKEREKASELEVELLLDAISDDDYKLDQRDTSSEDERDDLDQDAKKMRPTINQYH